MTGSRTDLPLRAEIFMRSLFVQASWNFDRLQNLGFAFMIFPAFTGRYGFQKSDPGRDFLRHLDFFNTHPYFSGLVAAAVAREEGGELDRDRFLSDLKRSLMSTLGGIGDSLFWATLRPLSALAALLPALFGLWWAPLLMLSLFNVPHIWIRWWGIREGLRRGCGVIQPLQALALPKKASLLSGAIPVLAALCAGAAGVHPEWALPVEAPLSLAGAVALFLAGMLFSGRRLSLRSCAAGVSVLLLGAILVKVAGP